MFEGHFGLCSPLHADIGDLTEHLEDLPQVLQTHQTSYKELGDRPPCEGGGGHVVQPADKRAGGTVGLGAVHRHVSPFTLFHSRSLV